MISWGDVSDERIKRVKKEIRNEGGGYDMCKAIDDMCRMEFVKEET